MAFIAWRFGRSSAFQAWSAWLLAEARTYKRSVFIASESSCIELRVLFHMLEFEFYHQKPISGRIDPDGDERTSLHQLFLLHMLRSAFVLTRRRRKSRYPSFTSVLPRKASIVRRESISTMVAPKYLTGDKASIDKFIDQFDVSCLFWRSRKATS